MSFGIDVNIPLYASDDMNCVEADPLGTPEGGAMRCNGCSPSVTRRDPHSSDLAGHNGDAAASKWR